MKQIINIRRTNCIYLIFVLIACFPLISCNFITMKFKGTGKEEIFTNEKDGIDCPDRIYINGTLALNKTCKYKFPNEIVMIKMEWDKIFIHCDEMFANISNILEIDLSQFNTSFIKSASYMFENCKSLHFVNISYIDISSLINIENIFKNCKSLKYIDLTNVDISKIPSQKINVYKTNIKQENINISHNNQRHLDESGYCYSTGCNYSHTNYQISTSNDYILNELDYSGDYRQFLIDYINSENEATIKSNNEAFTFTKVGAEAKLKLGGCENAIRNENGLVDSDAIYVYYHEVVNDQVLEVNYELFNKDQRFESSICGDAVKFVIDLPNKYHCNYDEDENSNSDNNELSFINGKATFNYNNYFEEKENNCLISLDIENITNNTAVFELIQESFLQEFSTEKGVDQFIKGIDNIVYQITTTENQLDLLKDKTKNKNKVSLIDLGTCEDKLKEEYNINKNDALIIIKYENVSSDLKPSEKNIQYDVFEPYNRTKLNLSVCDDITVNIFVKMELSQKTQAIYDDMKDKGYDMFNINDKFYQDLCTPYKSDGNTDVTLKDRKNYIYNNDDTQCQPNCYFSAYSVETEYMSCECNIIQNETETGVVVEELEAKKIYKIFIDALKYSNCDVMKCYKLVFSKNVLTKNLGSRIILIYFSIHLICYIVYLSKGEAPLKTKILKAVGLNNKRNNKNNAKNNINNINNIKNNKEKIIVIGPKKNKNIFSFPPKKKFVKKFNFSSVSIFNRKSSNAKRPTTKLKQKFVQNYVRTPNDSKIYIKEKNNFNLDGNYEKSFDNKKVENKKVIVKKEKLTDYELNELEYREAVKLDKRSFFQIYAAALKREHILFFTFCSCNDYNLIYVKIARFFVLIATDMAMNVFFFSDESMHKIFLSYGKFDFVQQIPQIVYSTIISQILEIFLCYLSMTDRYMYHIKKSKLKPKQISNIFKCINLKLVTFYFITILLFGLYWYIVSSFCSVYANTQIIFIKDSLSSFLLGIAYPIVIYLIPSTLRLCSIKSKNMSCLYKLSAIIPCV